MAIVHGTLANLDRTAVCENPDCTQFGELMGNHTVIHRNKTERGKKGECPECHGNLHNWHDADLTIQIQCLWRQAFGEEARKIDVSAANLDKVSGMIKKGEIKSWSNLALTRDLTTKRILGSTTATATSTTSTSAGTRPATTSTSATPSSVSVPSAPAPSQPAGPATPAPATVTTTTTVAPGRKKIDAATAAKLANIMAGARVGPSL